MNPGIEASIWLALRSRIETLPVGLPGMQYVDQDGLPYVDENGLLYTTGAFPKAWPGVAFKMPYGGTPKTLQPYLRVGRVSATPRRLMIDNNQPHERTGAVIISLVHPLNQPTVSVYDQYASEIAAWFAEGTTMRYGGICITVPDYPHVQEGYEDGGFWTIPVSIPWRCFA